MTYTRSNQVTDQVAASLSSLEQEQEKNIHLIDEARLQIEGEVYIIASNYREGFELAAFMNRYQDYFQKFDFIVGDWGYEQLRLRGFYQINRRQVPRDQQIDYLEDYLREYCNFGCRYFVIAKEAAYEKYGQLYENRLNRQLKQKFAHNISTRKAGESKQSKRRNQPEKVKATKKDLSTKIKVNPKVDSIHRSAQDVLDTHHQTGLSSNLSHPPKSKANKNQKTDGFQMRQVSKKDYQPENRKKNQKVENKKVNKRAKFTIKQLDK